MREHAFVVPRLTIDAVGKYGNHVLVGFFVEVVHLVPLVENICHQVWRGCVDDRRRDDVWDIAEVIMLRKSELGV